MPDDTDEMIARRVQEGDVEAFGTLMSRYEGKLRRYAKKFLFWEDDATDLVQDVFIKAYRNMRGFDASRRFSPWIYRIAHNEFVDALGRRGRERAVSFSIDELFPHPRAAEDADTETNLDELRQMLDRGLSSLPPKYREPLILRYLEDLTYEEIAEVLRIPVSTVGVRLMRGKEGLKRALNRYDISE